MIWMPSMRSSCTKVSEAQAHRIERASKGGPRNPLLEELSRGMVMSDNVTNVLIEMEKMETQPHRSLVDLINLVAYRPQLPTPAEKWEQDQRYRVVAHYLYTISQAHPNFFETRMVKVPGITVSTINPLIGAAPHAMIYQRNAPYAPLLNIMVKCPYETCHDDARYAAPGSEYSRKPDGTWYFKRTGAWYLEAQIEMGITGAPETEVIISTTKGVHMDRIKLDTALDCPSKYGQYLVSYFDCRMEQVEPFIRNHLFPWMARLGEPSCWEWTQTSQFRMDLN